MFLGVRVHLYMGCVAARVCGGLSTGYVAPCARCGGRSGLFCAPEHLLFSYRPSRKKTVIFEPLKTDGRADGNQKKRLPYTRHITKDTCE